MSCNFPLSAWYHKSGTGITFNINDAYVDRPLRVPCGQCTACRIARSKEWALRCIHEAQLHSENCFLTLTYAPEHLPEDGSLCYRDFQLFFKRLRKKFGSGIRFYMCGEYGEKLSRPHYHAIIFGFDFKDKVLWKKKRDFPLHVSEDLNALWRKGYCIIGDVSYESAAYVARYILKKWTGDAAEAHYNGKVPEFTRMSRRPGIARKWFEQYKGDIYPKDYYSIGKKKLRPPKYYDYLYDLEDSEAMRTIKDKRKLDNAFRPSYSITVLKERAVALARRFNRKKRNLDDD